MAKNDFKDMKEIDIIKVIKDPNTPRGIFNKACEYLIKKYEKTIHKAWWTFSRQMGGTPLVESRKDEFYSRAYEVVYNTILKVDLSRVYNDNFKLIQLVSLYLSNLRHTMINELSKEGRNISIETICNQEGEESPYVSSFIELAYYEREGYKQNPQYLVEVNENLSEYKKAIKECLSKWDPKEKAVYRGIISSKTKKEISSEIRISTNEVNNITKKVKSDLKRALIAMGYSHSNS